MALPAVTTAIPVTWSEVEPGWTRRVAQASNQPGCEPGSQNPKSVLRRIAVRNSETMHPKAKLANHTRVLRSAMILALPEREGTTRWDGLPVTLVCSWNLNWQQIVDRLSSIGRRNLPA